MPQVHARSDLDHLAPGQPDEPASSGPGGKASEAASPTPGGGADEDRGDARLSVADVLELEVVDLPATAALAVEQLVVEHAEGEVDLAHPWPMFESSSNGIAATAITSTTTR